MTAIDPSFLALHPDTQRWHIQRPKCQSCSNVRISGGTMHCAVAGTRRTGGRVMPYCIDARLPGADCGPAGALWSEAT